MLTSDIEKEDKISTANGVDAGDFIASHVFHPNARDFQSSQGYGTDQNPLRYLHPYTRCLGIKFAMKPLCRCDWRIASWCQIQV